MRSPGSQKVVLHDPTLVGGVDRKVRFASAALTSPHLSTLI